MTKREIAGLYTTVVLFIASVVMAVIVGFSTAPYSYSKDVLVAKFDISTILNQLPVGESGVTITINSISDKLPTELKSDSVWLRINVHTESKDTVVPMPHTLRGLEASFGIGIGFVVLACAIGAMVAWVGVKRKE